MDLGCGLGGDVVGFEGLRVGGMGWGCVGRGGKGGEWGEGLVRWEGGQRCVGVLVGGRWRGEGD